MTLCFLTVTLYALYILGTTNVLKQSQHGGMDVFVLVEAIARCVCSEEKELCRIGEVALQVVLETATTLMGSIDKVSVCTCTVYPDHVPSV